MGFRLILIDPVPTTRLGLAHRLKALGYHITLAEDGITGAGLALEDPPDAVIADLWTPGASGVQICRFLRSEPATATVPVFLRGDESDRRNRFWARHAGAVTLVGKDRVGELLRALDRELAMGDRTGEFFLQLAGGASDIRERIAKHLDTALFDSVIASEVRALAACETPQRLFDRLTQFVSQVHSYRWLAVHAPELRFFGLHHHPEADQAEAHARVALDVAPGLDAFRLEDADASAEPPLDEPLVRTIMLGGAPLGRIAVSPCQQGELGAEALATVLARELGAPLRVNALIDETRRLASTDALTGLMNRRALAEWMALEAPRVERYGYELSFGLLDVDRFKSINDVHGHAAGDRVLMEVARVVRKVLRDADVVARWGGEEIVFAMPQTSSEGAARAGERIRAALEAHPILADGGERIRVTASLGVATLRQGETIEDLTKRADAAMYRAKGMGRNRVVLDAAMTGATAA